MEPGSTRKGRVIIPCMGNSRRSRMAEAFWRRHDGTAWELFSAGTQPSGVVHPLAVTTMAERGIDIADRKPKSIGAFVGEPFDWVVTVYGDAQTRCPSLPGVKQRPHWPFDDPAAVEGSDEARTRACRRVPDETGERIKRWIARTTA